MSEIIVNKVTPPIDSPLVVDGSRAIAVDTIQTHTGKVKSVSNIPAIYSDKTLAEINEFEFTLNPTSGILALKANDQVYSFISDVGVDAIPRIYNFSAINYQVINDWTELPFSLNTVTTGTYVVQLSVLDGINKIGYYSGIAPVLSATTLPISSTSTAEVALTKMGEDVITLQLRIVRDQVSGQVKCHIKGDGVPPTQHKEIKLSMRAYL